MIVTGWTQPRLAQQLGVTFASLNRWLNKHAVPHPHMRQAILGLYKAEVGTIPLPADVLARAFRQLDQEKRRHPAPAKLLADSQALRDDLLLELTYNSNAIEGSTLTKKQTEAVIFDKASLPDKSLIEQLEAINHAFALNRIFDGDFAGPVTEKVVKELHRMIMQGISPDAGRYSKHHRAIRGIALRLPAPEDIQEEMDHLLKRINKPKGDMIGHVAKMHAVFEAIHPFGDGNGRVGRLVMAIHLINAGYPPPAIENRRKADYYDALEAAQMRSDTHLTIFLTECLQKSYEIFKKHRR